MSEVPVENVEVPEVVEVEALTPETALKEVVTNAAASHTLLKGVNQVVRAIDGSQAKAVVLAKDCDNEQYTGLVRTFCEEKSIPMFEAPSRVVLAEWAGLCRYDADNNPRNPVPCSSVAILSFKESEATKMLGL